MATGAWRNHGMFKNDFLPSIGIPTFIGGMPANKVNHIIFYNKIGLDFWRENTPTYFNFWQERS